MVLVREEINLVLFHLVCGIFMLVPPIGTGSYFFCSFLSRASFVLAPPGPKKRETTATHALNFRIKTQEKSFFRRIMTTMILRVFSVLLMSLGRPGVFWLWFSTVFVWSLNNNRHSDKWSVFKDFLTSFIFVLYILGWPSSSFWHSLKSDWHRIFV